MGVLNVEAPRSTPSWMTPMTGPSRRKQNRLNALHSTGPITPEGKAASSRNSLKHGFTAEILVLPNENPLDLQIQSDAFHDAFDPQSHDEDVLVDHLAHSTLRLERFAKAETAILSDQIISAELDWDLAQQNRVHELSCLMRQDPAKALIQLRSFKAGAEWLLARWLEFKACFDDVHGIAALEGIQELLRLAGFHPESLKTGPVAGYELLIRLCTGIHDYKKYQAFTDYLIDQYHPLWSAQKRPREFPSAESQVYIKARLAAEIASLEALLLTLTPIADASRALARDRALIPADTHQNRLFLRYRNSAEMTFNRTLKTLEKLQSDREKRVTQELENDDSRNEANAPARQTPKRLSIGSCVDCNGGRYRVHDMFGGKLLLNPESESLDSKEPSILPTPESVG